MIRATVALVACMLVVVPSAAWSQAPQTNAPPGNSGIQEYLETVPGASGNRPSGSAGRDEAGRDGGTPVGSRGDASGGTTLSPAARERLEQLGPDGKAVVGVVDATSPGGTPASERARPPQSAKPLTGEGRSPLSEVLTTAAGRDEGGMGIALPAILIGTVIGLIALTVMRRRSAY